MESINVFKGYGKVNLDLEDQPPSSTAAATTIHHRFPKKTTQKPFIITLTLIALLALTLLIAFMTTILIHKSNADPPHKSPSLSSNSVESLRTVCNVTQYPATCFTSISSLNVAAKSDPEAIFKLSLVVSIQDIKNMSSFLKALNDANSGAAIGDCLTQLDDALSRLNDSMSAMEVSSGEKVLTLEKINDIQTWISAAMTDQDTCVEGLEELGSTELDEVKNKMERSKQSVSNSLAIVAKIQSLLEKFGLKMY